MITSVVLAGCGDDDPTSQTSPTDAADDGTDVPAETDAADEGAESAPDPDGAEKFRILSVGDVLPHDDVNEGAEDDDGGWDFHPLMAGVQDWISGADLSLCSLEVPLAPEGEDPTGFPAFGAPEELITGLDEVGFHGCATANNHSVDRGVEGLELTLDALDEHGMGHVGTARTEAEALAPALYTLERGGREVTVAHFSTTLLHNILPPADEPWRVTDVDAATLTERAAQARADGADLVLASVHWGGEYIHEPDAQQVNYAEALAAGGEVDVIFGGHSHTPQPIAKLDGGPEGRGMWTAWSMGNFLSNQDSECCVMETATGLMVSAKVKVPDGESARVKGMDWAPVTVDRVDGHRGIWPLTELVGGARPEGLELDDDTIERRFDRVTEVMGTEDLLREPSTPTGAEPEVMHPRA